MKSPHPPHQLKDSDPEITPKTNPIWGEPLLAFM